MKQKVSIIITCYQSEGNLHALVADLEKVLSQWTQLSFELFFVDDGSTDNTTAELNQIFEQTPLRCTLLKLVRNFGSYNAFFAGVENAKADAYIYLHSDGEDPPVLIHDLLRHWQNGFRLAIAHRAAREDVGLLKPFSEIYHQLLNRFMPRKLPSGGFDLMLFDNRVKQQLVAMREKNINLVYLIAWMGFPYAAVPYKRVKRKNGHSQWTFRAKLKLFIDSLLGFSYFPVRLIWMLGIFLLLGSAAMLLWFLSSGGTVPVLPLIIAACTALVLIAQGVIGEYLWRVFDQVRNRPQYIVESISSNEMKAQAAADSPLTTAAAQEKSF